MATTRTPDDAERTDGERAELYFDEHIGPDLSTSGVPQVALNFMRGQYVKDALANPEALHELRKLYP